MYSMKPGRGPSAAGVVGAVIAAAFGVFLTASAASMGAPNFFVAFGVMFILVAICGGVYHFHNATSDNRMSEFDIVRTSAEPDPLARLAASRAAAPVIDAEPDGGFCTDCGAALSAEFNFCPKCGNAILKEPD